MTAVKICPSCGFLNDLQSSMCDNCLADISGISPVDTDAIQDTHDASATVIERKRVLSFTASDGSGGFNASSGAVIGREAEGREYLASHMTVSRRHAKLNFNGTWTIEDLDSSNGTFVNELRITPKEPYTIKMVIVWRCLVPACLRLRSELWILPLLSTKATFGNITKML